MSVRQFLPQPTPQADKITAEIRRWAREECDLVDNRYALYAWVTGFTDNTCTVTINVRLCVV